MADRAAPHLGGLARVHREPWVPPRGRARTVTVLVLVVAGLAVVGLGTALVLTGGPGELWHLLPSFGAPLGAALVGRRAVELGEAGIRPRYGVVRPRHVRPWTDVVEVRPAGRWDLHPVAVLDHERLDLRGMTTADVERLAAALAEARSRSDARRG